MNKNIENTLLQRHIHTLGKMKRLQLFADLANAHGLESTDHELFAMLRSEIKRGVTTHAEAVQSLFSSMIDHFICQHATETEILHIETCEASGARFLSNVRVISEKEMFAFAEELRAPSEGASWTIHNFAATLHFYESLFGAIDWEYVRRHLQENAAYVLSEMAEELAQGFHPTIESTTAQR